MHKKLISVGGRGFNPAVSGTFFSGVSTPEATGFDLFVSRFREGQNATNSQERQASLQRSDRDG